MNDFFESSVRELNLDERAEEKEESEIEGL